MPDPLHLHDQGVGPLALRAASKTAEHCWESVDLVEATCVEQRTDFDELILDVEAKPGMTSRDAVASAGKTLVGLCGLAQDLDEQAEGIDMDPATGRGAAARAVADLALPIEALGLSVRTYNALRRSGYAHVADLVVQSEGDLRALSNFGDRMIDEVKDMLQAPGAASVRT